MSDITPEMQAAIDAAVETATKSLKDHNTKLVGEVRDLKAAKATAEEAAQTAAEEAAHKSGDIEAIKKSLTDAHTKALNKLSAERDAAHAQLNTLLIDNGIQKALVDNNVAAHMHEPLTAMFKAQAKLADGKAMLGDVDINEGLKAYFLGDQGKHFVAAPANSGAGAVGAKVSVTGQGYTKDTLTLTEFSKLAKEDASNANAIAASVGASWRA